MHKLKSQNVAHATCIRRLGGSVQ